MSRIPSASPPIVATCSRIEKSADERSPLPNVSSIAPSSRIVNPTKPPDFSKCTEMRETGTRSLA
jgi:hypothetical protein